MPKEEQIQIQKNVILNDIDKFVELFKKITEDKEVEVINIWGVIDKTTEQKPNLTIGWKGKEVI